MIIKYNKYLLTLCMTLLGGNLYASAATLESHDHIRESARQYIQAEVDTHNFSEANINIGNIDPRLRLKQCQLPLSISMGNSKLPGNISVAVSCNQTKGWKIYLQAKVNAYSQVFVASTPISRGTSLAGIHVKRVRQNITFLNGNYFDELSSLNGHVARRLIRKGEVINSYMLAKSKMIKRGERVTIIAEKPGISVRMIGKAMNDAAAGETVRVKNLKSKRIIEGTAIKKGTVRVSM